MNSKGSNVSTRLKTFDKRLQDHLNVAEVVQTRTRNLPWS